MWPKFCAQVHIGLNSSIFGLSTDFPVYAAFSSAGGSRYYADTLGYYDAIED